MDREKDGGGIRRETDFELFPHLVGPVSDVQLLDCSPEQCSDSGWPLYPLFHPLSPLPPPQPVEHSRQHPLRNKNIPSPAIQGTSFTLSLFFFFSLSTLLSLTLPSFLLQYFPISTPPLLSPSSSSSPLCSTTVLPSWPQPLRRPLCSIAPNTPLPPFLPSVTHSQHLEER